MKLEEITGLSADPFLADELSSDDGIIEMANLDKSQTGIDGIVWISTMMIGHAPRIKYFVRPGRTQPSFSVLVADQPRVVANSLTPRVLNQMSPLVIQWLALNKDALLDFWHHGDTWTVSQQFSFFKISEKSSYHTLLGSPPPLR